MSRPHHPPQGVTVVTPDGPIELDAYLHFAGVDDDGMTRWIAYGPPGGLDVPGKPELLIALIPARTGVGVAIEMTPGGFHLFGHDEVCTQKEP